MSQQATIKNYIVWSFIVLLVSTLYNCKDTTVISEYEKIEAKAVHDNGQKFIGSTACIECHAEIYKTHIETAHYKTTTIADSSSLMGSFEQGKNTFELNKDVSFFMKATDSGHYQQAYSVLDDKELFSSKIDLVIGSGTKAQSLLTWDNDKLYQLQTSYYKLSNSWANSLGYAKGIVRSPRPITSRCLECHATYAKKVPTLYVKNQYEVNQMMYGIDCERCHGPSGKHVVYHRVNPKITDAKYILKQEDLSRQQRLDACALCHSGVRSEANLPAFSFLVGDKLSDFYGSNYTEKDKETIDVHSNQYELLSSSTCFKASTIDCNTCHSPHEKQRGNTILFNQKCIGCHSPKTVECKADKQMLLSNNNNCINCHMPVFDSKSLFIEIDSIKTAVQVRTHLIATYSDIK